MSQQELFDQLKLKRKKVLAHYGMTERIKDLNKAVKDGFEQVREGTALSMLIDEHMALRDGIYEMVQAIIDLDQDEWN